MQNFKTTLFLFGLFFFLLWNLNCQSPGFKAKDAFVRLEKVFTFPDKIDESSGIIFFENTLWTHNDSGDKAKLYVLDRESGKLKNTIHIKAIRNYDWEDISQDEKFIYVGDMGNNKGDRKDLKIYRLEKSSLLDKSPDEKVDSIRFYYPEQKSFIDGAYQHNFDCEAISSWGNEILLFTKNHQNFNCSLYTLNKETANQAAKLIHTFPAKGLITGSAIDKKKNLIALIGYERLTNERVFQPFIYLIKNWKGKMEKTEGEKIYLDMDAQTEGICSMGEGIFYISSEKSGSGKGKVFHFDANSYLK